MQSATADSAVLGVPRVQSLVPALLVLAGGLLFVDALVTWAVLASVVRGDVLSDWLSFYTAGAIIRSGHAQQLYDPSFQTAAQQWIFGPDVLPIGYPLPAFAAALFAPLSRLTFAQSYFAWLAVNTAALGTLLVCGWHWLKHVPRSMRAAFLAGAASIAFVTVILNAQVELFVVGGMVGCYALTRGNRRFTAGTVLALALVKPHVVAAIVLLLLAKRQWRILAGFIAVGGPLLIIPALLMSPRLFLEQARLLFSYTQSATEHRVNAEMMVNIRGPVTALTGSSNVWLWLPLLVGIALVSTLVALYVWRRRQALHPQSWALAFTLPLLYSPHIHFQSVLLLIAAAGLYLHADQQRRTPTVTTEHVLAAFICLNAIWLLSIASIPLMTFVVMLAYARFATRWTPVALRSQSKADAPPLAAAS